MICPPPQANSLSSLWKLIQAIECNDYWEQCGEVIPQNLHIMDPPETSLKHKSTQVRQQVWKGSHSQTEQQQLWLYPEQAQLSEQKKSTTPDLSWNSRKM